MVPKWCPRAWCFWEGCPRFQNGERMFVPRVHFGDHFQSLDVPLVPKAGPNGVTFRRNPKKDIWKIDIKVYVEKEQTMRGKGFKTCVEIDVKIDDKAMRFRNLRFLDFCREYNDKIVFPLTSLAIRGSDLSMIYGWCNFPRVPSGSLVLFFFGVIFVVFAAVL